MSCNESSKEINKSGPTNNNCGINDFVFDESFSPTTDFFSYVNNTWIKENPIPSEFTRWGGFEVLHEENLNKLHNLIKDYVPSEENSSKISNPFENIVTFYKKGMDETSLESEGISSSQKYLDKIFNTQNLNEYFSLLGNYTMKGIYCFFGLDVDADAKDSTRNVIYISQSGLGLPDRDYYFIESKEKERNEYNKYLIKILNNFNISDSEEVANKIYEMEKRLAEVSQTRTERRDPHLTYNEFTFKELCDKYPNINWISFINNTSLLEFCEWTPDNDTKIVIDNPKFLHELNDMFNEYSINELQWFLVSKTIDSIGNFLNKATHEIIFDFYGRVLLGQKESKPRWKRVMASIQHLLGQLLGRSYVEKYFPEESKKKCLEMVNHLKSALQEKINNASWMTSETKEKALLKLNSFGVKIGYPDKWRDYSLLQCNPNSSYLDYVLCCREFEIYWEYSQLKLPVDKTKWEMNPQEINAYYHPVLNEIVFPAGILQPPFYDANQHDAFNYGAIGAIIGHEMTHGFDDQGRKFDHEGNMIDWWTEKDVEEYTKRTNVIKQQYSNYVVEGENVNGQLTLGENIADIGGLLIAHHALSEKYNLQGSNRSIFQENSDQENNEINKNFFLAWARAWRTHMRKEAQLQRILTDPHSPAICRVNGVVKNIPEFYNTYNLKEGDALYLSPENRANIW